MNKTLIIEGFISGVVVICSAAGGAMLVRNMQSYNISDIEDKA